MRPRGYTLILALLISSLLLVLGMAFMSKQSSRYRLARLTADSVGAKAMARAGVEASRARLEHDLRYPPPDQRYRDEYSYQGRVTDLDSKSEVGGYEVTLDRRWMDPPYQILIVTSDGYLVHSQARYRIRLEIDLAEARPSFFKILRWEENLSP